jgi:hypothetical protein
MFKKILVAVLAAQLVISPVQAKAKCEQGFIGLDDAFILWLSAVLLMQTIRNFMKESEIEELKKKLEQEKAKQPAANTCLL